MDLTKRPDTVFLEQVREERRGFGVGRDEPLVKPAHHEKTPLLFDLCGLRPSTNEGNFVRLGRDAICTHLKAAKINA